MQTELYWIEGPWPGRLAIMPRPRGGDWLEEEILSWAQAGVQIVVSALTKEEVAELDLVRESDLCLAQGIDYLPFPILDRGVPTSRSLTARLVRQLERHLAEGKKVAIHCRQGVGRAALLAACVLTVGGLDATQVWDRLQAARGCPVPDTEEQRIWVARFTRDLKMEHPG